MHALYIYLVRPLLFLLDAERAHAVAAWLLRWIHRGGALRGALLGRANPPAPSLAVRALGCEFPSPVGMAAGFDKGAEMYNALGALGFGAVEVGTVTAEPQPGNPRPRLFRLRRDRAVVNRMGFNNPGAEAVAGRLRAVAARGVVLGVNIGKSKVTPLERAAEDYARSTRLLAPLARYLVVNVSSPNTPGLRSLQSVDALRGILLAVQGELRALPAPPPLLVKIAPDLSDEDVDAVADLALELGLAGLIATNTTVRRDGLETDAAVVASAGEGGLSGPPVRARALAVLRRVYARTRGRLTLVGVGGIETAEQAWETLRAGATLVQVYTAMIYAGPTLARELNEGLARRLAQGGYRSVEEVVGAELREAGEARAVRGEGAGAIA